MTNKRDLAPVLEPHYTTSAAARFTGCSSSHMRNLRLAEKGPRWITTADGTIRYPESALREYLKCEVQR